MKMYNLHFLNHCECYVCGGTCNFR